ncbi:alpha-amylase family protein [Aquiluna sp. KACHI24]|uniref:alpha-amylase n=1 Tax=Aquiluna sp. KACHI24 TaxID=2968831 RepID=UPI0022324AC1|nr:alpha-amylase family protein [Aquiluna sp. KACHI24]
MHSRLKSIASLLIAALALSGCSSQQSQPEGYVDQVGVQLFMYNWDSVANECEYLGEIGVDWALVAPPQEHILGDTWWTIYQPVSYQLESRFGTREEFAQMVKTCGDNGVDIIADAVINHMANNNGFGFAGTEFTKYDYPGLYSLEDFHDCNLTFDDSIQNYSDKAEVQTCELLGLPDLDQSRPNVQEKILAYLNDLISLGVKGFRFDAAKHMAAEDLQTIVDQLPAGTRIIHEVIRGAGEPIQPEDYLGSGDAWEFTYAHALKSYMEMEMMVPEGLDLRYIGHVPSESAVSFVSNHDTERNGKTLNYNNMVDFELATMLLLAENYGQPMLYSSYAFAGHDDGPNQTEAGVDDVSCEVDESGHSAVKDGYAPGEWICQHRFASTKAMLKFRSAVIGTSVDQVYQVDSSFGFSRGDKALFVMNVSSTQEAAIEMATSLKDGEYLDVLSGEKYEVSGGKFVTNLPAKSAIALIKG